MFKNRKSSSAIIRKRSQQQSDDENDDDADHRHHAAEEDTVDVASSVRKKNAGLKRSKFLSNSSSSSSSGARASAAASSGTEGFDDSTKVSYQGNVLGKKKDLFAVAKEIEDEKPELAGDGGDDDGLYHGQKGYKKFIIKRESGSLKKSGPIRGPSNVRSTTVFDYAPDICKDYKETGFCGYGDSCKFMHDRGDYKFGWQLDKDWESNKSQFSANDPNRYLVEGSEEDEESAEEDDLPFACFICRGPFVDPIVTRCRHYFCEKCALKHYSKSSKCYVCNEVTNGQFSIAKDLLKRLDEKRQKLEEQRKQEELDAEEGGDSDE